MFDQLRKIADCKELTNCNLQQFILLQLSCATGKFLKKNSKLRNSPVNFKPLRDSGSAFAS